MGPIGVKAHLIPFLPDHPETDGGERTVSAAPYGSPSILPISWSYCLMMGGEGLDPGDTCRDPQRQLYRQAAERRLRRALHVGKRGRVAHECIVDTRPLAERAGVTVDDVAKRLIDCGFHAPTMSWPVRRHADDRADRVGDQGRARPFLRRHARRFAKKPAPSRTAAWTGPTTRSRTRRIRSRTWSANGTVPIRARPACYPAGAFRVDKYWPPVNRVDNVYGDRNLVCSCPPTDTYLKAAE